MFGSLNFDRVFPEVARAETRFVVLSDHETIPDDTYGLREFYCTDPDCDCRRVILHVCSGRSGKTLASVSLSLDRDSEVGGPFLDPLNPQSRHSEALLEIVRETALADGSYLDRLERHYEMVKEAAGDPSHPRHDRIPSGEAPIEREAKVGRNEKCPCGSGKKYKKCCLEKDEADIARRAAMQAFVEGHDPDNGDYDDGGYDEEEDDLDTVDGSDLELLHPYAVLSLGERSWRLGEDRVAPSAVAKLGLEEILTQLRNSGLDVSPESFVEACRDRTSAWSISDAWVEQLAFDLTQKARDFHGLAACELWKRLQGDRPSQEMIFDWIEQGREHLDDGERENGYALWSRAWEVLRGRIGREMRTIEEARAVFEVGSLEDFLIDYTECLYELAVGDRGTAPRAIEVYEQVLAAFPDEDEDTRWFMRADLGALFFIAGRSTEAAALLLEVIREHPERSVGYATLAEALEKQGDAKRALELLEQAMQADVEDPDDFELADRIGRLKESLGLARDPDILEER